MLLHAVAWSRFVVILCMARKLAHMFWLIRVTLTAPALMASLMCPQPYNYDGRSSADRSPSMLGPTETVSAPATPLGAALTGSDFR